MYLGTRYVVLASLCLIVKLGCIALLLQLQAASSPSRNCTPPFFYPPPPLPSSQLRIHAGVQSLRQFQPPPHMGHRDSPSRPHEHRAHKALPALRANRRRRMGRACPQQRNLPSRARARATRTAIQRLAVPPAALPRHHQA